MHFSTDSQRIVGSKWQSCLSVLNTNTLKPVFEPQHPSPIVQNAFSPDGRTLAIAGQQSIGFWNCATGQEVMTSVIPIARGWRMMQFSRDCRRLALLYTDSERAEVYVWDTSGVR